MPTLSELVSWMSNPDVSRILITILLGYLILLWVSLIIWTTKDIISRTNNVIYQLISIALVVMLNIFGLLIYLGIRPSKTLIEKFFEDLEYEALAQATKIKKDEKEKGKKTRRKRKPRKKKTRSRSKSKSSKKSSKEQTEKKKTTGKKKSTGRKKRKSTKKKK
ncbi:hypothetical protein GF369_04210 [Candidatus Peregrinibacteria bacterium]|nr:hypothetical protein [Candidatus Peregrinibacteria bacterium]